MVVLIVIPKMISYTYSSKKYSKIVLFIIIVKSLKADLISITNHTFLMFFSKRDSSSK